MSRDGIWLIDPKTNEPQFIHYDDLDPDIIPQLWKPVGGFCYSADSFLHLPLPEVPFYLQNWLPKKGKAELFGQAKSGKSYLCIQLARCIASGDNFLGIPTQKAPVLYLQFELGEGILQYRMRSTGKDYEGVYVGTTFSMKLDKREGQDQFLKAISAVQPQVVIIDPFYKVISGDENEAHDVLIILNFLDEVIDTYNCSIFIIHHAGKELERGGRGSSVLEGWVDSYIEIRKVSEKDEPLRCKISPKMLRHSALPPKPTEIILAPDFEFILAEKRKTTYDRVRELLVEHGVVTGGELIASGVGNRKSIYDALSKLAEAGDVEKSGITYLWKGMKKAEKQSASEHEGESECPNGDDVSIAP